jgi:hypothetical protein
MGKKIRTWTEAEELFSRRGKLLEEIASVADEIKAIDDRLELLRSIGLKYDLGCSKAFSE